MVGVGLDNLCILLWNGVSESGLAQSSRREGKGREEILSSRKGRNTFFPPFLPREEIDLQHTCHSRCSSDILAYHICANQRDNFCYIKSMQTDP